MEKFRGSYWMKVVNKGAMEQLINNPDDYCWVADGRAVLVTMESLWDAV